MEEKILEKEVLWFNLVEQVKAIKFELAKEAPNTQEVKDLQDKVSALESEVISLESRIEALEQL